MTPTTRFTITNSGNVGIGTTSPPTELLQVMGGSIRQGSNYLYSDAGNSTLHFNSKFVGGATPFQKFANGFSGSFNFSVGGDGALVYSNGATANGGTNFSYVSRFAILNNGTVAIGQDVGGSGFVVPSGFLLAVKGKVICEEVKVKLYANGWPDYVFGKSYKLRTLSEVETFIEKNQHLPEMPSAKELEQNGGLAVSEMLTKQQEKIEELTLYLIAQSKDIKDLRTELETIKTKGGIK